MARFEMDKRLARKAAEQSAGFKLYDDRPPKDPHGLKYALAFVVVFAGLAWLAIDALIALLRAL